MAPVIGVTATLRDDVEKVAERPLGKFVRADLDYVEGVAEAGGVPVVLPPVVGPESVDALLDGLNGLVLSGGSDLSPSYYGEEPVPEMGITIPERDEFEMALVEGALLRGLPIFGICRGLQVLNVALGGSLYQDLPTQFGGDVLKHRQETPKWQPTHEVEVDGSSLVGDILGSRTLKVNSYHHQAIKDLSDEFVVCARSGDGVIEAIEARNMSECWILAVQWHAEAMREAGPEQRNLFEAHVDAAERHASRRAAA